MEVVSLEFNTLHGTTIYGHSSAEAYFESYYLTAVLATVTLKYYASLAREVLYVVH